MNINSLPSLVRPPLSRQAAQVLTNIRQLNRSEQITIAISILQSLDQPLVPQQFLPPLLPLPPVALPPHPLVVNKPAAQLDKRKREEENPLSKRQTINSVASQRDDVPKGSSFNQIEFCLGEIKRNPSYAPGYSNLASTLPRGGVVTLPDGSILNEQQLHLKTIELDPSYALTYYILATTLPSGGTVILPNRSEFNKQQLCQRATELDPSLAPACAKLLSIQPVDGSTTVPNGSLLGEHPAPLSYEEAVKRVARIYFPNHRDEDTDMTEMDESR